MLSFSPKWWSKRPDATRLSVRRTHFLNDGTCRGPVTAKKIVPKQVRRMEWWLSQPVGDRLGYYQSVPKSPSTRVENSLTPLSGRNRRSQPVGDRLGSIVFFPNFQVYVSCNTQSERVNARSANEMTTFSMVTLSTPSPSPSSKRNFCPR